MSIPARIRVFTSQAPLRLSHLIFALALAIVSACLLGALASHGKAAPYLGCSPNGYIFKYQSSTTTQVQAVDMVTGQGSSAGQLTNHQFNAVGFNPKDNHFYGWDLHTSTFIRVSSDLSTVEPLTINGYSGPTNNIFAGDVDEDGHYWQFVGSTWYEIDLNTSPNPTFVASGTPASNPSGTNGTDWAFMPGTNSLYRAMDEAGGIRVWAFDRTTKLWSLVGHVSNISTATDGDMGAVYADPEMNFYVSSHNSGKLFRIDLTQTAPFTAVELGAAESQSNDGARCALASVPTDYSDAPSSYHTLIADDGPRHSVISFNVASSTAPLMLGTHVDIENDGFPAADAQGDDDDHEGEPNSPFVDDERGVTSIVATPGSSAPLTVPVRVTNTGGQAAVLVGWIDLDGDGLFETSERVATNVAGGFSAYKSLTFPAPPAPYSTNTYARFRLFAANDPSVAASSQLPTGPAASGEVEDVLIQVGAYDVSKSANPPEGRTVDPGQVISYTLTISNTGSTALNNLKIDDDLADVLDDATVQGIPAVTPSSAGSASVSGNTLEFEGDIGIGGTVTVTYSVKIKSSGTLGNSALNNYVLANHSTSCNPQVGGSGGTTLSDPDCKTNHTVGGLADTGSSIILPLLGGFGLLGGACAAFYVSSKRSKSNCAVCDGS